MREYTKIQTLFKRDMANKGRIIESEWSVPEFEYLKDNLWTFTEKVDGTNIRLRWNEGAFSIGGKTDNSQIPSKFLDAISTMDLPSKFQAVFPDTDVCLYGEGYGGGIQGETYGPEQDFILFDVLIGEFWLLREEVQDIANKLGLKTVPIIGYGTLKDAIEMTRSGFKSTWGDFMAEGIVMRPAVELRTRRGDRMIAKIKHVDFKGSNKESA